MSAASEQDRLDPNHPMYYAPRRSSERTGLRPVSSQEATVERASRQGSAAASFDAELTNAVSEALRHPPVATVVREPSRPFDTRLEKALPKTVRHPLDPDIIHEHPELARQRMAMFDTVRRFALPIGIAAIAALVFVMMVPASWRSDSAVSSFGPTEPTRTDPPQVIPPQVIPPQVIKTEAEPKSALAEFQGLLAPPNANEPVTREQPGELLQGFVQWRQKSESSEPARK